jgi:hypothetical protein
MLWQSGSDVVIPVRHRRISLAATCREGLLLCILALAIPCNVHAQAPTPAPNGANDAEPTRCLPSGNGYLKARLSGAVQAELNWGNAGTDCTGAVRPTDGGIRMRFSRPARDADSKDAGLVLLFGIANLSEGVSAQAMPVNLTVIREGAGEFYSTQGDDKCMLDKVSQEKLVMPHRARVYRIVARGYCTEPARAVNGKGSVLVSRFDYAGRVDFGNEEADEAPAEQEQVRSRNPSSRPPEPPPP